MCGKYKARRGGGAGREGGCEVGIPLDGLENANVSFHVFSKILFPFSRRSKITSLEQFRFVFCLQNL